MTKLLPVALLLPALLAAAGAQQQAEQLFARTDYRQAVEVLKPLADRGDASAIAWTGKSWFMLSDYKKASDAFERAVAASPGNSEYYHWLGKAFGRRAETSNPLSAPLLASKARQNFEKAVQLDSRNGEAINDLFSYYLEAPGFLGGGLDKAEALAEKIKALDPVEYHFALAQLWEKRKQFQTAETHFRSAWAMAPRSVGRAIDLATFLSRQGREQESEAVFAQAEKIAPNTPRLLFERASAYVRARKNISAAKQMLERYLQSSLTPDDPPRADAEKLLKQASALGT